MNKKAAAYVLLKNYLNYEEVIEVIDEYVKKKAVNSHITTYGYGGSYESIEDITLAIIKMIEKKRIIINCRLLVLETLEELSEKQSQILKMKFFQNKTLEQIGEHYNFSPIQARRLLVKSFRSFFCLIANKEPFIHVCESDFMFHKPFKLDYNRVLTNEKLAKTGLFA